MDPVQKMWMFHHWIGDQQDQADLAKNQAYLIGSFWNPEAVKQLMGNDVIQTTDEELEESSMMVKNKVNVYGITENKSKEPIRKRKRRILKD